MFGARINIRCPVHGLIVPNRTRLALRPEIATLPCSPHKAQDRRKTGNKRNTVSSSKSRTALGGICFNRRTIAPFFESDADPSLHRSSEAA